LTESPVEVICPVCGECEVVSKVSKIYLNSLSGNLQVEPKDKLTGTSAHEGDQPTRQIRELGPRFAPPSGKTQTLRSLHPDQIVGAVFLISLFFLWQISTSQPGGLLPALGVWILGLALYVFNRKRLLARHAAQQADQKAQKLAVERAISRWMELYYCGKDDVIFIAGQDQSVLADEMNNFLFS